MIRFTVYSILFALSSLSLSGQYKYQVEVYYQDSTAADGVEFFAVELDKFFYTNRKGQVHFSSKQDALSVSVFKPDYQSQSLILKAGQSRKIFLVPIAAELKEVEVRGVKGNSQRRNLRAVEGTSIYASKKSEVLKLKNLNLDLGANNPRQIYAQVTGLNIYEGSAGGMQLNVGGRGLDPNRSSNFNVRQNGYDISADVLGYPESYYTPPAEALSEVKVVKGAASLQYGTQFGGLLEFKLKDPLKDTSLGIELRQSYGSFNRLNTFLSFSGTTGNWSYYSYFNYKEGAAWQENSAYTSRNAFLDLRYQIDSEQQLSLELSYLNYWAKQAGGLTDSQFEENPQQSLRDRNWFQVDWQLYTLKYQWQPSPKDLIESQVFALNAQRNALGFRGLPQTYNLNPITTIDEKDAEGNYLYPRDLIKGRFQNWGTESRWLRRYGSAQNRKVWLLGFKYYQAQNTSRQGAGSKGLDPDFRFYDRQFQDYPSQSNFDFPNKNASLFSEHIWNIGPNWSITPGLRAEWIKTETRGAYQNLVFDNAGNLIFRDTLRDDRTFDRAFLLAGLGVSYRWQAKVESYFNFSQNYRSVTFSDIRTISPSFVIDPNISDEKGFTADIGTRGEWQNVDFDVNIFGLLYGNRIGIILNDRAQRVRKNIGTAFIYGLESFVHQDWTLSKNWHGSYFLNLAYTRSIYLQSEENNVLGKRVEFIPEINMKLGVDVSYRRYALSLQGTYLSEQYTDVENSARPRAGDIREGIIGPIPAYSIWDLNLSYRAPRFELGASLNNIFNAIYFTRRATGYPGPGIISSDPRSFSLFAVFRL